MVNAMGQNYTRRVVFCKLCYKVGFFKTVEYLYYRLISKLLKRSYFHIRIKKFPFPIYIRANSSDNFVFYQIFVQEEYSSLEDIKEPKLVVDCGAYAGYSSMWFLNKFPSAHVIAVEPDRYNSDICEKNIRPYGKRVSLLYSAVWPYKAKLKLRRGVYGDGREWATQVEECSEGEKYDIEGIDIASLIGNAGYEHIDILKIDIEETEQLLFSLNYTKWLNRVKNIVIELHSKKCEEIFFNALSGYNYDLSTSGELTVCKNISSR